MDLPAKPTNFESIKHTDEDGVEYWLARQLQPLLEYKDWDNFLNVVSKAKESLLTSGGSVENHFRDVTEMVVTGYSQRAISNYRLTRYACYLISQNGDSRKPAIALAQSYFATQTRRQELVEIERKELKRLEARKKLTETEKHFSETMYNRDVDGKGMAEIRSVGDEKLFGGFSTAKMRDKYGIKQNKPIADVMPTVGLKAKDLAAEMTTVNTENKDLKGKLPIKAEHIDNNEEVREALEKRGIKLEELPAE